MKAIQTKFGNQPRAYADHEWQWRIDPEGATKDEVLEWCKTNLLPDSCPNALSVEEYRIKASLTLPFDEMMEAVCRGRYTLFQSTNGGYVFNVTLDYID